MGIEWDVNRLVVGLQELADLKKKAILLLHLLNLGVLCNRARNHSPYMASKNIKSHKLMIVVQSPSVHPYGQ